MNARDELAEIIANFRDDWYKVARKSPAGIDRDEADEILAAGYSKPRTISTAAELESLPLGSAVRTSDDSDTVVLRGEGEMFRNQSGGEVDWTTLWRFGTHPFTLLYTPKES